MVNGPDQAVRRLQIRRAVALLVLLTLAVACGGKKAPSTVKPPKRYVEEGIASWYGKKYHGRTTANGERFDMRALTAAHRTLPFGTVVKVTNLENGRTVEVRINDRGPFVKGRVIDLAKGAAKKLDMIQAGVVRVRLEIRR